MTISLEMKFVTKQFEAKLLYDSTSFVFEPGCYAISGPNGTGKTVLLEMLAGVINQNQGEIVLHERFHNHSLEFKRQLVYVPAKPAFFPSATGAEFLNFIAALHSKPNRSEYDDLIRDFSLKPHLHTSFSDMSLGTQKKLFLTTLATAEKSLFILDEPSNGLDQESCEFLVSLLLSKAQQGIVILATHDTLLVEKLNPAIIRLTKSPVTFL